MMEAKNEHLANCGSHCLQSSPAPGVTGRAGGGSEEALRFHVPTAQEQGGGDKHMVHLPAGVLILAPRPDPKPSSVPHLRTGDDDDNT